MYLTDFKSPNYKKHPLNFELETSNSFYVNAISVLCFFSIDLCENCQAFFVGMAIVLFIFFSVVDGCGFFQSPQSLSLEPACG